MPKATLNKLPLKKQFWRTTDDSTDVMECKVKAACLGGNDTSAYCLEGHEGPYCDVCKQGYSKDVMGICKSCSDTFSAWRVVTTVVVLLLMIFFIIIFKKKVYKKHKRKFQGLKAALRILFVSYQIMAGLPSIVPEMNLPDNFVKTMER